LTLLFISIIVQGRGITLVEPWTTTFNNTTYNSNDYQCKMIPCTQHQPWTLWFPKPTTRKWFFKTKQSTCYAQGMRNFRVYNHKGDRSTNITKNSINLNIYSYTLGPDWSEHLKIWYCQSNKNSSYHLIANTKTIFILDCVKFVAVQWLPKTYIMPLIVEHSTTPHI